MGYIELEQFVLGAGLTRDEFCALDDAMQAWSYTHRAGLARRTTAFGEDNSVLVVTLHHAPPSPLGLDGAAADAPVTADPLDRVHRAIEPGSYRRQVFEDRG